MKKQILSLAAGAALVFAAQNSFAGSTTAVNLIYDAVLNGGCTATITPPASGNLATQSIPYSNVADRPAGTLVVTCSKSTLYGVCVNGGSNYNKATGGAQRNLASGTNYLAYSLDDAVGAGTKVGDKGCGTRITAPGSYTDTTDATEPYISGTGDAPNAVTTNLYADVIIPTNSVPGTYTDTVSVTVVW